MKQQFSYLAQQLRNTTLKVDDTYVWLAVFLTNFYGKPFYNDNDMGEDVYTRMLKLRDTKNTSSPRVESNY